MRSTGTVSIPLRSPQATLALPDRAHYGEEAIWFNAARSILIVVLFLAPLAFGAVEPWAFGSIILLTVAALFCWAAGCVSEQRIVLLRTPIYIPALLFAGFAAMQFFTGQTADRIATRDSLLACSAYLLVFTLSGSLFSYRGTRQWSQFGQAVTIYSLVLSLFSIIQFFTAPERIYWTVIPRWGGSIFGPYVNHDHYAGLMEMIFPITAMFWITRPRDDAWSYWAGFATLSSLSSVALCGSRAGIASLLIEVIVLAFIATAYRRQNRTQHGAGAGLALGILGAALFIAWLIPAEVAAHWQLAVQSPTIEMRTRTAMTRDSFSILRAHPWTGVGLGAFETVYPQYQSFASDLRIGHAHNDYAELLAETGAAGGLCMLAALTLFLIACWRNLRQTLSGMSGSTSLLQLATAVACGGLLLHSFFDFNLHIPANAAWFAFCAGIASIRG